MKYLLIILLTGCSHHGSQIVIADVDKHIHAACLDHGGKDYVMAAETLVICKDGSIQVWGDGSGIIFTVPEEYSLGDVL